MVLKHVVCVTSLAVLLGLVGCGGDGEVPRYPVSGTVSYQGTPIAAGEISFEDESTGHAAAAAVEDGSYDLLVPAGKFKVYITPALVEVESADGESPPQMEESDGKRIPDKYRRIDTTDLKAEVTATSTTFDFDMQ